MRRREFIAVLGSAVVWPVTSAKAALPSIGYLSGGGLSSHGRFAALFRAGLGDTGHVEGQNVSIEYRWAEGVSDRVPIFAEELVRRPVDLIYAGGTAEAISAKALTSTIPIVFTGSSDPVAIGLVASLNRPGGNVTGVTRIGHSMGPKRLELLRELVPATGLVAIFVNPKNPSADIDVKETEAAARILGVQTTVVTARSANEIEKAIQAAAQQRVDALTIGGDPLFSRFRDQIAALAVRYRIPAISRYREEAKAGVLMSYGPSFSDSYRQAGVYAGRILKGEKPADLPVVQPTRFELVINLKTANTLGLSVPPTLLARADEVIE